MGQAFRPAALIGSHVLKETGPKTWHTLKGMADGSASLEVPDGSQLVLKTYMIRPLELKSIFNGNDLTGWKTFPGKRSKFTVTKEGTLNIADGPGDTNP